MFAILSSQLAFSAASTLAKKSFEFGITSSLRGLSDVIRDRFQHSKALQDTQGELELKVKMLCLPVDILAHHVTQGNTALQEPLGVALGVLDEVEAFRQALVAQDVARAQDASSPDGSAANAAQLCKRLKELVARLDSVLPYLNLAISTVALLNQGPAAPLSASRLMAASWHLRSNPHPGAAVFSLPEASWHEERQLTAAGRAMSEAFRRCSLTVCRSQIAGGVDDSPHAAGGGGAGLEHASDRGGLYFGGYVLLLQQDLDDGLYHERGESGATLRLQVCDIVGLDWETTQSLNQGDNEYRPALVLHVLHSGSAAGAAAGPAAAGAVAGEAAPQAGDRDTAAKQPLAVQQLVAPQRTPDSAASRPGSRARSRLGAEAAAGSTSGSREPSPSKAALAAGMVTPQPARPSPGAAASGRLGAGVGGSIRRYAVMLNMRRGGESDGEEDEEGSEDGRGGQADGSSSDDELDQRQQAAAAAAPTPSTAGHDRRAALQAAAASPLPPQLAQQGGPALGSSLLQREWQLLGELEYVLRLCILESREQLPHHEVPDERIQMAFQATSVPSAAAFSSSSGALAAPSFHAAPAAAAAAAALDAVGSTQQRHRSAAAAARWRSAAAEAAAALREGVREGVEAVTHGVRQLSFTPGGSAAAAASPPAGASSGEAGGSVAGRTRSSSRTGGRGFGSPVQ